MQESASNSAASPAPVSEPEATKSAELLKASAAESAGKLSGTRPIELVFGLVGPTGVDQHAVAAALKRQLAVLNYEAVEISLSDIIAGYDGNGQKFDDEFARISGLMTHGDALRRRANRADIIALLGIIKIRAERVKHGGEPSEPSHSRRIAYLVRSFKRPEEVALFRDVYGKAFSLISIYASRVSRVENLRKRFIGRSTLGDERTPSELAHHLMNRDYKEERDEAFGQKVGDTFPLADYFVVSEIRSKVDRQLERLVRLIFGDPYISPTADEQSMFFAQAAALRSLDLSRQVGAAIITEDGCVVSTGCNDVPRAGGGLYWADDESCERDYERGSDANVDVKKELVIDALKRLNEGSLLRPLEKDETIENLAKKLLFDKPAILGDSKLFDVIEFGRSVHAEMAAITNASRVGSALRGTRLFCTTFPCHICARHIVAAGIKEVVFIEPYEKSRVSELYQDSIVVEPVEKATDRVAFRSFFGVAPRRYLEFFQPATKRKSKSGEIRPIQEIAQNPRIKRITFTYTSVEEAVILGATLPPKVATSTQEPTQ